MRSAYTVRYVGPPGWRLIPVVTRATLVLSVIGYLTFVFAPAAASWLVLETQAVFPALQLWRLLTYPFVTADIFSLLFGLLMLWSFGSELESERGSRSYAGFLLVATVIASLLGVVMSLLLPATGFRFAAGLSPILIAQVFAWMWLGPNRPSNFFGILPMTRKVFAFIALVIVLFAELQLSHSILGSLSKLLFLVGGLPVAWLWIRRGGRPGGFSMPRFLRRRRFRVVRQPDIDEVFH